MKILIFGAGYLGRRLVETWPEAVLVQTRIDEPEAVAKALDEHRPDVVVNAAGKTGTPNVDWCETHQAETFHSNVIGPLILAEACQARGIYLLHLGSGCVYYGPSPDPAGWREDDPANPISYYSRSKYAADLLLSRFPNVGIARLRMPIDSRPAPRNLVDKLAAYRQVVDVANSVTVVEDFIAAAHALLEKRASGIFHLTNPGVMRHRDLLALYKEYVDPNHSCEWISEGELVTRGLAQKTRSNCILQSPRLEALGIHMRPIAIALRDTLEKYARHMRLTEHGTQNTDHGLPSNLYPLTSTPRMKGVILAGGKGTRLAPLTNITNKHLLPIYDKPMVLYPLETLLRSGIRDIMLVTGPEYANQFIKLLGSGSALGVRLSYRIQDEAGGIAQALGLAEDFVGADNCTVILGDNVFDQSIAEHVAAFRSGASAFYKPVGNPSDYGVMEIDAQGRVLSIEEKPREPKSNLAQVGLYMYDSRVFEIIKTLKPSGRGELEITDVNNHFVRLNELKAHPLHGIWWDMGTFKGMHEASLHFAQKATEKT
ncbi:MAG: sugar phosphate nucleotidyltransferase [Patescibacteria group bacterium]